MIALIILLPIYYQIHIPQLQKLFTHLPHLNLNYSIIQSQTKSDQHFQIQSSNDLVKISGGQRGVIYGIIQVYKNISLGRRVIDISDEPEYEYRGIMIDSARHFLPKEKILKVLDGMALVHLNFLHWHIADDQSFPLQVSSKIHIKQINITSGSYSKNQIYTKSDVKEIVDYAHNYGIQIIPEIDTPGHSRSWKYVDQNGVIHCQGGQGYNGQLDVTLNFTINLVRSVITQIAQMFPSKYIHLGGDEVSQKCWDLRPSIKKYMKLHNIKSYGLLQQLWRTQLKKNITNKTTIFWKNNNKDIQTGPDDIVQYWGKSSQAEQRKYIVIELNSSQSKIIMSPQDLLYLNTGAGFIKGNPFGHFSVWTQIYKKFNPSPQGINPQRILGAQACLWGQVSNEQNLQNNLWMRAAVMADILWKKQKSSLSSLGQRILQVKQKMQSMGIDVSPFTSQWCQNNIQKCFQN